MLHAEDNVRPAVLWDLDGTLVDTLPVHWQVWREVLRNEGRDLTYEQFVLSFGLRNDATLRTWYGAGIPGAEIERISDAKERRFRDTIKTDPPAMLPGARHWLAELAAAGWHQAVATMAPRLNLEAMLAALGLDTFFETMVAAEDVARGKPDPQIFEVAAARLGVGPARCVVVEDSAAGIEAARRAGMGCIGVNPRFSATGDASQPPADFVVPRLDHLPADAFERLIAGPRSRSGT